MKKYIPSGKIAALIIFFFSATLHSMGGNLPKPDHIVFIIMENHSYADIIGSSSAPHINALLSDTDAASFTQSYAIEHPSQPNYLDLFSGSNQGMTSDNLPGTFPFTTANLGYELISASHTFATYSEDLPSVGYNGATSGNYARKHNPAANWMGTGTNLIASTTNQPYTAFPSSSNYASLPTFCYVIPNLNDDMHNGTIQEGDTWIYNNITSYIKWAETHNSLLVITFDEDDNSSGNQIPTIFIGQMVKGGNYSEHITHYIVLRTMEDMYSLPHAGSAASASPITDCWRSLTTTTGIENVTENNISVNVFPNPASSYVNFAISNYSASTTPAYLSIVDILGRTQQQIKLEETPTLEVNTSSFANGIYFYYISQNGATGKSGKFIVTH